MKKYLIIFFILVLIFLLMKLSDFFSPAVKATKINKLAGVSVDETIDLLRRRNDELALAQFEKILANDPDNADALWAKAEVLRRIREYEKAEAVIRQVLAKNPEHLASLNTLAYIKYKEDDIDGALALVNRVLSSPDCDNENRGLAYMMLGTINSKIASDSGLVRKLTYAGKIKGNLLKAKQLAPNLAEVRLALGTFYLLAPMIIGGNINKAIRELEAAIEIAPDFATANARLAQAYKIKRLRDKYLLYLNRAKALDPENEVVTELEK